MELCCFLHNHFIKKEAACKLINSLKLLIKNYQYYQLKYYLFCQQF